MFRDNLSWVSHVSAHLTTKAMATLSFKNLWSKQPQKNSVSLQGKGQVCLLPVIKDFDSLNLGFHPYNAPHSNAGIIWTSLCPVEIMTIMLNTVAVSNYVLLT